MNIRPVYALASLVLLLGLSSAPLAAADMDAAKAAWEKHCALCHGKDGAGATKVGKKLKLKDYTDPAVQAELKDEDMFKVTKEGIKDEAGKEKMEAYGAKLSDDEIKAVVAYIRSFKKS